MLVITPTTFLPTYPTYPTYRHILPTHPKTDETAEIIHVRRRRRKKVWSFVSQKVSNVAVVNKSRSIGEYGSVLADTEVQGTSMSFYHFNFHQNGWIDYTERVNIGDSFSIESGEKEALARFKSWLTQTYENVQSVSKIGGLKAVEEDLAPRTDLYKSCRSAGRKQAPRESKTLWNKIIDNFEAFVCPHSFIYHHDYHHRYRDNYKDIYDRNFHNPSTKELNKPPKHLSQSIALKAFSKTPTTWTLKETAKEPYLYTGYLLGRGYGTEERMKDVVIDKSRYIVFRMKDNVYFVGGYISPKIVEGQRIENDKLCRIDRYNLNEHRWVICEHSSPYPLENSSVVVSSDQTCAIFIGGQKNWKKRGKKGDRIIIFEEETGFTLLEDKMLKRRSNDVAIMLPI